jgi:hypothetical protein
VNFEVDAAHGLDLAVLLDEALSLYHRLHFQALTAVPARAFRKTSCSFV